MSANTSKLVEGSATFVSSATPPLSTKNSYFRFDDDAAFGGSPDLASDGIS
jgi:hypothetical protein